MERPNLFLSTNLRFCHSNLFARIWREPVCHAPRSLIRVPFCRYDVTLPLRDEIKQTKRGTRFLPFSKKRQVSSGIVFVSFAGFPVSLQEKATWTASTGRVHSRSRFVFVFLSLGVHERNVLMDVAAGSSRLFFIPPAELEGRLRRHGRIHACPPGNGQNSATGKQPALGGNGRVASLLCRAIRSSHLFS